MKALRKDFFMEIRKSYARFISIFFIVALGVAFYSGIQSASPDMRYSGDAYFDEKSLMDVKVVGTLGLTDQDVEALKQVEGVEKAEPGYGLDVLCGEGEEESVIHLESLLPTMNQVSITQGRLPEKKGECLVDSEFMDSSGFQVGDTLLFRTDGDSDLLQVKRFEIVGVGSSPLYISFSRGNTTLGSGEVAGFAYVTADNFDQDYYTQIYLEAKGSRELTTYTDAYDDLMDQVADRVEGIEEERCQARFTQVKDEADEKLADARKELDDGKKEAEEKLADAKEEIEDGEKKLADGREEVADGEKKLADARQELQDGKKELADARKELEDGERQLSDARRTLADGKSQLIQGKQELADGEKQLAEGKKTAQDGQDQFDAAKAEIVANRKKVDAAKAELASGRKQLEDGKKQLAEGEQAIAESRKELEDNKQKIVDAKKQIAEGRAQIARTKEELPKQQAQIDAGFQALEEPKANLEIARQQLQAQQQELDAGKAQAQARISELQGQADAIEGQIAQLQEQYNAMQEAGASQEELAGLQGQMDALRQNLGTIQAGIGEIQSGIEQADAAIAQAWEEFRGNEAALADQEASLQKDQQALDAGWAELTATEQQLNEIEQGLPAQEEKIKDGEKLLNEKEADLAENKQTLAAAEAKITQGEKSLAQQEAPLIEGEKQLAEKEAQLAQGWKEIQDNEAKLEAARQQIAQSEAQLASGEQEIADNAQKITDGWKEIADNEPKLSDGEKEISDNEVKLADAKGKIEENTIKLADGRKKYEDAKKEAEDTIADGEKKIADAQKDIDDLEEPEWLVTDRQALPEYSGYGDNADRIRNIGQVFPALFFLVAALISLTTMTRMVEEQRTQIGTMKALGYGKGAIASKYLLYALLATIGGSITGILIGEKILPYIIITAYGIMYHHMSNVVIPYQVGFGLMASGAAVACTMIATSAACYKELAETPASLMRPPAPKEGKRVLLERVTILWKHLSFTWKSTIRNLFRYKKRFFMTIFGIGGCMALMLVGFGLRDSIIDIANLQYNQIQTYDSMVIEDEDASGEEKAELQEFLESNEKLELHTNVLSKKLITYQKKVERTVYLAVPENPQEFYQFVHLRDRKTGETYTLDDHGAILSEKMASLLNISEGDTMKVEDDGKEAEVKISHICENYVSHYLYMTPAYYEQCFGEKPEYNDIYLEMADQYKEQAVSLGQEILRYPAALSISYTGSVMDQVNDMLTSLDTVMVVLIISAGMLAFVVLYNLNNINVTERQRELATIKVLGFYDLEVSEYVLRENVLLTLIGIVVGIFLGIVLHRFTIVTVEVDSAMFGRNINWPSFVLSALITAAFSGIVNVFMHFKLKKIDMVESLKSVE